jgi:hypothetical protein
MAEGAFAGVTPLVGRRVVGVGLGEDRWTDDARSAGIVVTNRGTRGWAIALELECGASPADLPVTASVSGKGGPVARLVLGSGETRRVRLPAVPPGHTSLFVVSVDRGWVLRGADRERPGLRVGIALEGLLPPIVAGTSDPLYRSALAEAIWAGGVPETRRLPGSPAASAGLDPTGLLLAGRSAALVVTNRSHEDARFAIGLRCDACDPGSPLAATVDDSEGRAGATLDGPEERRVALAAVAPFTRRLAVIRVEGGGAARQDASPRGLRVRIVAGRARR